jgi:hypothetical protein
MGQWYDQYIINWASEKSCVSLVVWATYTSVVNMVRWAGHVLILWTIYYLIITTFYNTYIHNIPINNIPLRIDRSSAGRGRRRARPRAPGRRRTCGRPGMTWRGFGAPAVCVNYHIT